MATETGAMDLQKKIIQILSATIFVILGGSLGYYLLFNGEPRFVDCIYMTMISLTTVGYGEVIPITGNIPAQVFTIILITFGMGIIVYGLSTFTALLIEGEISGILRKKKMEKQIQKLRNHYIVCGGGETGRHIVEELKKNLEKTVLIDSDPANIEKCRSVADILYIEGDATDDQHLIAAGIAHAAGIVICLPSDKDNLYITMTARMLNMNLRIISKMVDKKIGPKLRMAGADGVVSPNFIGALRMASEMIRPAAVDFLDSMLRSQKGNLRIHEIPIPAQSSAIGKPLGDLKIQDRFHLLVLGARQKGKDIEFNPPASNVIEKEMSLIVMGDVEGIAKARKAV